MQISSDSCFGVLRHLFKRSVFFHNLGHSRGLNIEASNPIVELHFNSPYIAYGTMSVMVPTSYRLRVLHEKPSVSLTTQVT